MNMIKAALVALLITAGISPAMGQSAPANLPGQSVYGRLGIAGDTGPGQAIPISRLNIFLLNSLCQTNGAFPIYSSSSGTWICSPTQTANRVFAGPSTGSAAIATFRALVGADLPLPAASTLGGVMSKAAVASNWLRSIGTDGIPTASQPAFTDISGTASAAQLPNPTASTLGGIRSYAAVSNQWINTISTSGIPSSTQPACANISDASVYCSAARGQLPGETSTGGANAGNVGELVASVILSGAPVSLSTGTPTTITSIVLTAGDWDISAQPAITGNASTTFTGIRSSISTTIATENLVAPFFVSQSYSTATVLATFDWAQAISPTRVSISGSTTYYLVTRANFATSTASGYGSIRARRLR